VEELSPPASTFPWTVEAGIILIKWPVIIKRLSFHLATKGRNRHLKVAKSSINTNAFTTTDCGVNGNFD
jgi:hypothetical protein